MTQFPRRPRNIKICFSDNFIEQQPILFTSITPRGPGGAKIKGSEMKCAFNPLPV